MSLGFLTRVLPISILMIVILPSLRGQDKQTPQDFAKYRAINEFFDQNEKCFACHGGVKYILEDTLLGTKVTQQMCDCRIIKREAFYVSNHRTFECTDCHSSEYETFPHSIEARVEEHAICIDCHGGDETWSKYHFEEIQAEYDSSTHAKIEGFSCWKCHNPHTYKINIRNSKDLSLSIAYDNAICLSCHSDFDKFQLLTSREEINIIQKHEWLPNQHLHFSSVRCIECHTEANDSVLVAHEILPAKQAVKKCSECHSQNSILMSTLYKYQAKTLRSEAGFFNAVILNNAFVIGANRNYYLNLISIVLFGLTLIGIIIHSTFRIILKH